MDDGYGVFGVDVSGWVEQHRSRDVYEVVREPIQNALDTGTDLYVRIDYDDQSVVVEDYAADGVEDLSHFYALFSGDKYYEPEKRGRFGRGIKEFIGASDTTVISSTGGALKFDIAASYNETRDEYVVEASRETYAEANRDRGTVVYGTNDDWGRDDLAAVQDFVEELWMPEEQQLRLEVYDGTSQWEAVLTPEEPDAVLEHQYLSTLTVEEGMPKQKNRRTTVQVKKTRPGDGGVYEMGIPVTTSEAFPFLFNVQQKTPVTERRNELESSYRTALMRGLINERLDLFDDEELSEDYVTQYLSRYTNQIATPVQREYIHRRYDTDPDDLLVYTEGTPPIAVAWAVQQQIPTEKADDYSRHVSGILTKQCDSVEEWYTEMKDGQTIEVVDAPTPEQVELIEYFESEIMARTRTNGVDFELAVITGGTENGQTRATYSPVNETIYLNVLADDWDKPTPERIGTALHELGHHEGSDDGHGSEWYHTVETLSGDVIQSLRNELDRERRTGANQ